MNAIKRHLGLVVSGAIVAASVWACTATREKDGSVTVAFAPEKAINTRGLEDCLRKLNDLMEGCLTGRFPTPCTEAQRNEISKAIQWALRRKAKVDSSGPVGTG